MNNNSNKDINLRVITVFIIFVIVLVNYFNNTVLFKNTINVSTKEYMVANKKEEIYLSDIEYIANQSYTRWDKIRYDEVNGRGKITVKIENNVFTFKKGIWAHASSQVTYDISKYNYKYFTTFVGINTTSNSGNGVIYHIYTSEDGQDWKEASSVTKKPGENATFIKVNISKAKYLRLCANDNGANGNDHSVYADAKLVNEAEQTSAFKSVDEYNEIIKSQYTGQTDITGELELNVLRKELIQNVGQYTINSFYNESADNKAVLDWLMSNQKALRYYILGGKPEGTYYNSLVQLSRLYRNYKNDFNNTGVTQYGTVLGDLYTRMAISLSLTHSKLVGLWMQSGQTENQSDAVRRYAIYKYMHKNGNLNVITGLDITKWFENYTIEEMRFVMNNNIDDEEILWLNAYTQQFIDAQGSVGNRLTPHPYMAYVWPNYSNELYYSEENKEYFNDLFSVPDKKNPGKKIGLWDLTYTIPGGVDSPEYTIKITRGTSERKLYKVWMNMRNKFGTGAVCGGISKTGSNIRGVHGIPSAVIGQPGHAAIIYYTQDANGNGYWNLDNDVSGWAYSEKGERMLLGWGNASYSRGYSVVYMALAQEVINDNPRFEQSEKFVYLANSYKNDEVKQEQAYRKALEIQPLNINAWYGLIDLYNNSSSKTEDEYYELAKEVAEELKYFPLPMYHLTNLIKPKLTSIGASFKFTLLQTRILTEASVVPNNTADSYTVYQPSLTRLEANFLLGKLDSSIATFSFDGEDAGKIVLSSRFDGNGVRWDYAIKGKGANGVWDVGDFKEVSFSADEEHKLQLTKEEIASITSENDIYIHIVGVNYAEENIYKIDINESRGLPATLFASDLENKVLGAVDTIEWKYNEKDNWTTYKSKQPDLTGNKTVILRMGATGTYLASKTSSTFTFTKDVVNNKRKYIPVEHVSLHAVSTEATSASQQGNATNALDANYNTRWHSAWNGSDTQRFITVKLDQPYNISAVEFVPAGGGNGKIYDGTIWGSMDGENWTILTQSKNLTYTNAANTVEDAMANIKSFDITAPQRVQYVKIVADRTNGNWFTARAFNFYEDTSLTKSDLDKNNISNVGVAKDEETNTNNSSVVATQNNSTPKSKNNGTKTTNTDINRENNVNNNTSVSSNVNNGDDTTTTSAVETKKGNSQNDGEVTNSAGNQSIDNDTSVKESSEKRIETKKTKKVKDISNDNSSLSENKVSKVKKSLMNSIKNVKETDNTLFYIIIIAIIVSIVGIIYICYKNAKEKNDLDY